MPDFFQLGSQTANTVRRSDKTTTLYNIKWLYRRHNERVNNFTYKTIMPHQASTLFKWIEATFVICRAATLQYRSNFPDFYRQPELCYEPLSITDTTRAVKRPHTSAKENMIWIRTLDPDYCQNLMRTAMSKDTSVVKFS